MSSHFFQSPELKEALAPLGPGAGERIFGLIDTPPAILSPVGRAPVVTKAKAGHLRFDQVWFSYQDEDWVLKDVSLEINPGERVAVVV